MILCGINLAWSNCAGTSSVKPYYFEANNIHEAAIATLKCNWSNSFQGQTVKYGEFHDTDTHNTWSVDSGGHTQKNYRRESESVFKARWQQEAKL